MHAGATVAADTSTQSAFAPATVATPPTAALTAGEGALLALATGATVALYTVGGKRVLRPQDVQQHYPVLTPHVLRDIPTAALPKVQLNRKNVSYRIEDLERYIERHRNAGAADSAGAI